MKCMHCDQKPVNFTDTLCHDHMDIYCKARKMIEQGELQIKRIENVYYIPEDYEMDTISDETGWYALRVNEGVGQTETEFINNVSVSEIDQDGGERTTYGWDESSGELQESLLQVALYKGQFEVK